MKIQLKNTLIEAINNGYQYFISGMAIGFDMIAAEIVLELKKNYSHIELICALPCKNQDKLWREPEKIRYAKILKQAKVRRYISEDYTASCMLERNDYMLKHSSLVVALYNGLGGGTGSTIKKAEKLGVKIIVLKP